MRGSRSRLLWRSASLVELLAFTDSIEVDEPAATLPRKVRVESTGRVISTIRLSS